jgi:hypothetical protein
LSENACARNGVSSIGHQADAGFGHPEFRPHDLEPVLGQEVGLVNEEPVDTVPLWGEARLNAEKKSGFLKGDLAVVLHDLSHVP